MAKDYYKILGISKTASQDEIKKAYRRLAHQHHPDKKGGDEQKFKEINEAYQVLSNEERRRNYDRFGTAEPFGQGFGGQNPFGGFDFNFGGQGFSDVGDLGEFFDSFFEGIGVRPKRKTYQRGSDVEVVVRITLEEAFRGATKGIDYSVMAKCEKCKGQGGDPASGMKTCSVCAGQGEIREERKTFFGSFSQVKTCTTCRGFGQIPNKICSHCKGNGRVDSKKNVHIEILPGVQDDQVIKIKGGGEAGERGAPEGDLYVRVKVEPHRVFERRGDELLIKKDLNVVDLLLGKKIEVPTISGGKLNVEIPAHFNLKEPLKIPGEGMPRFGSFGRGELLVDFTIKAPKKLTGKTKELLEGIEGDLH